MARRTKAEADETRAKLLERVYDLLSSNATNAK